MIHQLKITCEKYGRLSEMIVRQKDEFDNRDRNAIWQYALHYWDCDDLHLSISISKVPAV